MCAIVIVERIIQSIKILLSLTTTGGVGKIFFFFLGYFCTFELCGPEIGHLVAVHLTAKRGSHKFQKYGQKRRLLSYRQLIFLAVLESYFSAEFRSVPF
jgi:hypothetical protein